MSKNRLLTPCVGRCSTVFGDSVCHGCRRFSGEVINWNTYTPEIQKLVWDRLDRQLDHIILRYFPLRDMELVEKFLELNRVRLLPSASVGRKLYSALKICQKRPASIVDSGLNILKSDIQKIWTEFERKVLVLAGAEYEISHLRAIRNN